MELEMGSPDGGTDGLRFTSHAASRARERGIGSELVAYIIKEAEIRYPGAPQHGQCRLVHVLGEIVVITTEPGDDSILEVISVMWRNRDGSAAA